MTRNIETIIGCDGEYEDAHIVVWGAPFDSTASYRPGARFASQHIRRESYGIETYSPYQDKDLLDYAYFDAGDLELPFGSPERALQMIEERTAKLLSDKKLPFMLGGEHLVTYGAVKAAAAAYPDLCIVHFDAHADLRQDYLGAELSHATVMRRCHELTGDGRIFQFGIRSGDREEMRWGQEHVSTCLFGFDTLCDTVKALKGRPVYFTLDLDVLDSSVLPGTGTPEAGGVAFNELLGALKETAKLDIVALDMNELNPMLDPGGASTAAACKLLREILLYLS